MNEKNRFGWDKQEKGKISPIDYLFHCGLSKTDYEKIRPIAAENNRVYLRLYTKIAALFFLLLIVFCSFESFVETHVILYIGMLIIYIICIFVLSRRINSRIVDQIIIVVFFSAIFLFGIAIGVVYDPSNPASTYMAVLVVLPIILHIPPFHMITVTLFFDAVFAYLAVMYKHGETLHGDLFNVAAFTALGAIICIVLTKHKSEKLILELRLKEMYRIDQLTGVCNRNSYEKTVRSISYDDFTNIYCVYIDVNGLHELNNTKGHDAGDRMLIFVAEQIMKKFGRENTFRIGGDEFVVLGTELTGREVQAKLDDLTEIILKEGYSIASGMEWAEKDMMPVGVLIRSAETKMYDDKQEYYSRMGRQHR